MRRFIIGTLALFATLLLAYFMEGGNPLDLVLPSPLIITVCVPCCAVLAVWSLKDWGRAWMDAFSREQGSDSRSRSARLWGFFEKACYIAGIVGFILGFTIIFRTPSLSSDPERFRQTIGVNCSTPILAIFLAMVARILRARVEERG